jgi:hypothetical protein
MKIVSWQSIAETNFKAVRMYVTNVFAAEHILSHTSSENTGNIHESNCKKCIEYESQLREALDELGSAREITEILQKELSIYLPSNNACGSDPVSPKASSKPVSPMDWTQIPTRNYSLNPNKSKNRVITTSGHTIKTANRFPLLHNLEAVNTVLHGPQQQKKSTPAEVAKDTENHHKIGITIPTIINGRLSFNPNKISTPAKKKKSIAAFCRNHITKEHKVRMIGDSHLIANLHFTLWMCIADDSSKVKGVKAVFIRISSKVNIQSDQ